MLCMGSGSATGFFYAVRLVHSLLKYFFKFQLWYWIQIFKFVIDNSDISLNCLQHIQKRSNFDAKVTCHQPICLLLNAILSGVGVGQGAMHRKFTFKVKSKYVRIHVSIFSPSGFVTCGIAFLGMLLNLKMSFNLKNDLIYCGRTLNLNLIITRPITLRSLPPTSDLFLCPKCTSCPYVWARAGMHAGQLAPAVQGPVS